MHQESLSSTITAEAEPAGYRNGFQIGGVSIEISGSRESDVALLPSLEPFRFLSPSPDIEMHVDWLPSIPMISAGQVFDSGAVWRLSTETDGYCFDFNVPSLGERPYRRLLIDLSFRQATLQMSRECFASVTRRADPLEYPLDELLVMHRLTQERAIELHGTGIVRPSGESNLFIGHSGAGKSTTTRLWTAVEDVEVLSDDRIIVRRDGGALEDVGGLRLRGRSAKPTGHSTQDDKSRSAVRDTGNSMRMYGTPWHGEAMFASPNSALLTRIFVLEHGHGNVITPLRSSHAVAELFARSFVPFHRHEYVDSALDFLQELVSAVPVYRYEFEPDQRAVEKIRNFHD